MPVAGKPILGHILDKLIDANIREVCLIIGSFGNHVIDYISVIEASSILHVIYQEALVNWIRSVN